MTWVNLPPTLRAQIGGASRVEVTVGSTVGDALRALEASHPQLVGWILDEQGRLRQHVNVFAGDRRVHLESAVGNDEDLHVLQAISGGGERSIEVLVGTRKGLFVLSGEANGEPLEGPRLFGGQTVDFAVRDPRSGRAFAAVTHGQFGPRLYYADDELGSPDSWQVAEGPRFPEAVDAAVERIWSVVPGEAPGELWAGVAPAALFHSRDDGASWSLVESLWNVPSRPLWEGGLGGLCLHSICPWPGEPKRLAIGISAAGVWITDDGAKTWRRGGRGLVPRYLPEEAREDALMLCVHNMHRVRQIPERLYMQFHGGVYRSDDTGVTWTDIGASLPADFGFPLALDPHDPDRAFVIPLSSDEDRVTPEGRLRVFETRDRGDSWQALENGLPQANTHVTVLRQALDDDGRDPLGLVFGTTTGELFGSFDGGTHWHRLALGHLPPILSVRCS